MPEPEVHFGNMQFTNGIFKNFSSIWSGEIYQGFVDKHSMEPEGKGILVSSDGSKI